MTPEDRLKFASWRTKLGRLLEVPFLRAGVFRESGSFEFPKRFIKGERMRIELPLNVVNELGRGLNDGQELLVNVKITRLEWIASSTLEHDKEWQLLKEDFKKLGIEIG